MSIDDKPRSGRPSTARIDENVEKIREHVLTDPHQTIDQQSESSGLSWSSVQRALTEDLGMKRIAAKFVPRALTDTTMHLHTEPSLLHCFWLKMTWFCSPTHLTRQTWLHAIFFYFHT